MGSSLDSEVKELSNDLRKVRALLRAAGVPAKLLNSISTRAQNSGRRTTGAHPSNRKSRWLLNPKDPQFGTEADCKRIHLRLLAMLCEFVDAPVITKEAVDILAKYLGRSPMSGPYRDALTRERLSYTQFLHEVTNSRAGISEFHIGHDDPTINPRHVPSNISWRSHRSNLIQGNMTLTESRTKFVELIGRYFELGEINVTPDEVGPI